MFDQLLALQNPHWSGKLYEADVERSCFSRLIDYLATGQVVAITGVRRAGKSTLMKQLINYLISQEKIAAERLMFVNLEHPYLSPYREEISALERLYEDYLKMMQPEGQVYLFLDEVQFFKDWPLFVKAHHETKQVRFVVTGSNAAMVSSDLITLLSGRSLPLEILPFSLREIAVSRGIEVDSCHALACNRPALRHLLDEMLEYGGFPSIVVGDHKRAAFDLLGAHARTVLLQDVVPRLAMRKPAELEQLYTYLMSHIGKLFTYAGLGKLFSLSDKSIKEYLQALADAHLAYEVDLFSYSLKQQLRSPKKAYSIDTGQANAVGFQFSSNRGRLLENLIFIDLKRLGLAVYYYKTKEDCEVDFLIKEGSTIALVQVTWDLHDPSVLERELRSLQQAMKELSCSNATLLMAESPLHPLPSIDQIQLLSADEYLLLPPKERKQRLFLR